LAQEIKIKARDNWQTYTYLYYKYKIPRKYKKIKELKKLNFK